MYPGAFIAQNADKGAFDVHVDIFKGDIVFKIPGFDTPEDIGQFLSDGFGGSFGNDPLFGKHGHMSDAAHDVMLVKPLIERDRL